MKKRWIAALLALVLCVLLAACGKETPADTGGETGTTTGGENTPNAPEGNERLPGIARVEADYNTSEGYLSEVCLYDAEDVLKYKVTYDDEGYPMGVYIYDQGDDPVRYLHSSSGKQWRLVYECTLDAQGHKTGFTRYDEYSGETESTRQFTYEGDLLVCEVIFDAAGVETDRYVYQYDAAGRQTKWEQYVGGATTPARYDAYEYDEKGNRIRWSIVYPSFSANNSVYEYEYDEKGQLLKRTNDDGQYEEYAYDDYGNQIRQTVSNSGEWLYTYEPRENGNLLSIETATTKNAYTYDEDGHLIRIERSEGNALVHKYDMTYDEKGNQITRVHYTYTDGVETLAERCAYEYDAYGFRTKTVTYDATGATVSEASYEDIPLG